MTYKYYVTPKPTICPKCGKTDYSDPALIDTKKTIKRFNILFWILFTPALILGTPRIFEFLNSPTYYFNNENFLIISMIAITLLLISLAIKIAKFHFEEPHYGRVCNCCGNTMHKY